jgi:hypothetical protein
LDGHEFRTGLDTGASFSVLNMEDAQDAFGLTPQSPGIEPGEKLNNDPLLDNYFYSFKNLALEGVTVSNPRIQLLPDLVKAHLNRSHYMEARLAAFDDGEPQGLPALVIGYSILRRLHVYIAYKEQKLYITPVTAPATNAAPPAPTADAAQSAPAPGPVPPQEISTH